jgi:hypothetical protein
VAGPRVHSALPARLAGVLTEVLWRGGVEHVDAGPEHPVEAAAAAAEDPRAVAFVGPFRSSHVGETAAILNEAGLAQLAPAATYAALTRDEPGAEDGMPASLAPTGRGTLFRVAARDTAVCQALVARVGSRCVLLDDGGSYGEQVAGQLRLAGVEPDDGADTVLYAGLADGAPLDALRATGPRPLFTLDGAWDPDFVEALGRDRVRFAMALYPQPDWSVEAVQAFLPQTAEAGMLITGSVMAAGADRAAVLEGLRSCGRFDEYGDTNERRIGLWAMGEDGGMVAVDTLLRP